MRVRRYESRRLLRRLALTTAATTAAQPSLESVALIGEV